MMFARSAIGFAALALFTAPTCDAFVGAGPLGLSKGFRATPARSGVMSTQMALKGSERVAVLGAFERIGVCAAKVLADSEFTPYVQVQEGFTERSRVKWPIDGYGESLPPGVNAVTELPVCEGAILASEEPADAAEIDYVINDLNGLQKVVFLSRAGVSKKDDFMNKLNPFSKLEQWYQAEEAIKKTCAEKGIEFSIVRAGALEGGPFFNSNKEFQSALEANLFDLTTKALEISSQDSIDGQTGRDLAACALVQALSRDVETFSIIGKKEGPLSCSTENHMDVQKSGKDRRVFTPTPAEWDKAFDSL